MTSTCKQLTVLHHTFLIIYYTCTNLCLLSGKVLHLLSLPAVFIGEIGVFFGAFLGPIFAILLFNSVMFVIVTVVLVRHTRSSLGRMNKEKMNRKSTIRLLISLAGIMALFGLTWLFAALTVEEASLAFQFLFAIFNSLQGFFIFLFFCVISKDARELWKDAFARHAPKGQGQYVSNTSGPARINRDRPRSKATLSSTLSSSVQPYLYIPETYRGKENEPLYCH